MTTELENKLIGYMTDIIAEGLLEEIDNSVFYKYDDLDEVLYDEWNENDPELAEWFKELRNVDIKKFDNYTAFRNDFCLEKAVSYSVKTEVEQLFGKSKYKATHYETYFGLEWSFFTPKDFFDDKVELKEINKYIRKHKHDTAWLEWFTEILFDSVVAAIKTKWYFYNLLKMDEDEIKDLQF